MNVVPVGNRLIGCGEPCFIIAEAGVNHCGDVGLAHQLIDVASDAGADAVKFQRFKADALVSAQAVPAPYQAPTAGSSSQREMLSSLVLADEAWPELAHHAFERGIIFLATPFDLESADQLQKLGVPAFKVASGELDNLAFLDNLARRGLPMLISTGMGDLAEVDAAVAAARPAPGICLFHCLTAYPAPASEANLMSIPTMRERFGVPVGWSDHTTREVTAVAATALGASLIEKHVTLDRSLPGPDHASSADPRQFAAYVSSVRQTESALGDGVKRLADAESENRVHARRSFHAAHDLAAGAAIGPDDVILQRPATGLSPSTSLARLRARRLISAGQPITFESVRRLHSLDDRTYHSPF